MVRVQGWKVNSCNLLFLCQDGLVSVGAHLAISALLLASSAIWLSSVKLVRSVNILVSGGCNPCRVLCACAHLSSRASFPKSFCLVKAICIAKKSIKTGSGHQW